MAESRRGKGIQRIESEGEGGSRATDSVNETGRLSTYTRRAKQPAYYETKEHKREAKRARKNDVASKGGGTGEPSTVGNCQNENPRTTGHSASREPQNASVVYLTTRCTPSRFAKTIKKFNGEQRDAIESLGLGGLLYVQQMSMGVQLIQSLASRLDLATNQVRVHGKLIPFSVEEVRRILGLANSGTEAPVDCSKEEEVEIRAKYNLTSGEIKVGDLESNLHKLSGNEFKAKFVMYAIGTILNPPTGVHVSSKHLAIIRNLEWCPNMNWARFTYEGLIDRVRHFQHTKTELSASKYITGCVLLLQLWYVERLFVVGSVTTPLKMRDVPRVKHWSRKAITKIMETVSKITVDLDDNKVQMLEDAVESDRLDMGGNAQLFETMGVILRQQANIMARQDSMDAKLASLQEEFLGSLDAKFERLREDLFNELEEKLRKFSDDIRGQRVSTPDTEIKFNQRTWEDDVCGGVGLTHPSKEESDLQLRMPSFYENLAALDLSMEVMNPITIGETSMAAAENVLGDEDLGQPPVLDHATIKKEEASPSSGVRMTLRPSTARRKPPTNVTGQASAGSSVAIMKARRVAKRAGIPSSNEIKKGPALRSPYQQTRTRAAEGGKQRLAARKRQQAVPVPVMDAFADAALTGVSEDAISQIYEYVFDNTTKGGDGEAIVDTPSGVLTRRDLKDTFKPRGWMSSMIIDSVSDLLILTDINSKDGRKNWYLPCRFVQCCKPNNPLENFTATYIKDNWYADPRTLPDRIYVPMNESHHHWYLLLLDIHRRTAYILDSLPQRDDNKKRRERVNLLLAKLDEMCEDESLQYVRREHLTSFRLFGIVNLKCQRQANTWDCGVHVMQYMRQVWTDIETLTCLPPIKDVRRELLHWMTCHRYNNAEVRKSVVLESHKLRKSKYKSMSREIAAKEDGIEPAAASTSRVVETGGYRPLHPAVEKRIQRRERFQFTMHDLTGK